LVDFCLLDAVAGSECLHACTCANHFNARAVSLCSIPVNTSLTRSYDCPRARVGCNPGNMVVRQENASLSSMGTDQLLDLFNVSDSKEESSSKAGESSEVCCKEEKHS